jgi:hydrogenase nickel incorporation protein HypA/HybF
MHELSVAQNLVDLIAEQLAAGPAVARVRTVRVRVGALSGVVPAALRSAWPAAARGTPFRRAVLQIDEEPVVLWCGACAAERPARGVQSLRCATCGAPSADVRGGRELELVSLEVSDDETPNPRSANADPEEQ